MTENQLATTTPTEATPTGIIALIDRIAATPDVDIDKLERLLALQERMMKTQAQIDFDDAIARICKKLTHIRIVKKKSVGYDIDKNDKSKGTKTAFKYTPLEEIDRIVKPMLDEEQITFSVSMEQGTNGWYNVTGTLTRKGHSKSSTMPLPLDASGGKNNVQGAGSTSSYGARYTLSRLLNIVTVGEDDDGGGGTITNEQAVEIDLLIAESKVNKEKFLERMGAATAQDIMTKDYARAVNSLKAVLYDKKQKAEKKEAKDGKA